MAEQKENLYVKFLHKPYQDYCLTKKEQLKKENCLWICYRKPPKNDNKLYSYYAKIIKHLNNKYRTILFHGVPVRLSKQQMCMLWILLTVGEMRYTDYIELSQVCNGKKMKKTAVDTNLKCFMHDFNKKIIDAVTEFMKKHKCYFTERKEELQTSVKNLIYYESLGGYTIKTNYSLSVVKERVKVNCKK